MTRDYIEEASKSAVNPGDSIIDDAIKHGIFASVALQDQGYPGYFIPVISTRFRRHLYE